MIYKRRSRRDDPVSHPKGKGEGRGKEREKKQGQRGEGDLK